jgi:hypothetical protein
MIDITKLLFRNKTNDENVFNNVFNLNEYKLIELPEESVVVDIGAHIGSFSLKAFEKGSRNIFSFEANIHNSLISKYNCEPYNIKVFNKAVRGNKNLLSVSSSFAGKGEHLPEIINYGGIAIGLGNDVEVTTLEEILNLVGGNIDILKLDCEGSEYPIIFESNKDVFNNIKYIVGEIHPGTLPINFCEGFVNNATNLEQYLKEQNYETKFIVNTENGFGHFFCNKK